MNNPIKAFNVNLITRTAPGAPSFFACTVLCTEEEYESFDNIVDMVCEAAEERGMTVPGFGDGGDTPIICDENDSLGKVLDYGSDWDACPKLSLAEYLAKEPEEVEVPA